MAEPRSDREKTSISKKALATQLHDAKVSMLAKYMDKAYGTRSLFPVLSSELKVFLFCDLTGGAGYFFRKMFYGGMLRKAGRGVIYGRGLILRHPRKISFGDRVSIDDDVLIDASGAGEGGITLGDDVIVSRSCVIQGKTGPVSIGDHADIGCNCIFSSVSGIEIGKSNLIAGHCYIGGGRYRSDLRDVPMMDQGVYSEGPVILGEDVWLGAGVVVLDGIRIGKGSIIGAGAVVTKEIPEYSLAVGAPARVIGARGQ